MKRKLLALCLSALMVISLIPTAFAQEVNEQEPAVTVQSASQDEVTGASTANAAAETLAGNSIGSATTISMGKTYNGSISATNTQDYYKFTLSTSGTVSLKSVASGMRYVDYLFYDASGNKMWGDTPYWNTSTELINVEKTFYLTSGTYYFAMEKYSYGDYFGTYNFSFSFTSAGETFKEPQGGSDNSISNAHSISFGSRYKGQIAMNDDRDFYKFTLSTSGTLTLDAIANSMRYTTFKFYDESGNELWSETPYWNTSTEQIVLDEKLYLTSGTYYFSVEKYSYGDYFGNYNFALSFASAGESFKEPQGGSNNSIAEADSIGLNTTYKGQIAINDDRDFYKFTLPSADTITLSGTANMKYLSFKIFDSKGNEIWDERPYWNSSTETITIAEPVELTGGTYYLEIEEDNYYGNYSFKIISKFVQAPSTVSGLKIGGRAADALRLNWNKSGNADGYIIEQYKSGKWVRIARIGSGNTLTYRVEKLSASTTYKFRVKSFATNGSTALYSGYTYINGKTNPSIMTGVKIAGWAKDALRISWNKNTTASGYIIEQYKSGKWVRIARIAKNSTTTYRVENLAPATTYKFRIRAFGFDGSTALYGNSVSVSGKTTSSVSPSAVSGLKIGGRAADALRLNWNKSSNAKGYIIEQYKNGAWTRIARIGSGNTLTYRVENLRASTTYKFRVKSFAMNGSTAVYSGYTYINGKTNPSIMTGVKIAGWAKDALRINWNKNTTASGYIIEQYKSGKWVRIARIAKNTTTTYRVENLRPSTSYMFRVQAFGFDGSTALYSNYQYVSGSTL